MNFLPDEARASGRGLNMAPMIDFLFLMVVFFATLAVSRIATRDTEVDLVRVEAPAGAVPAEQQGWHIVRLTIDSDGSYKWVTEIRDYPIESSQAIARELQVQHRKGLLPKDKDQTKVLLRVDRQAQWEPVLEAILAIRREGFEVRPIYEPA